MFLYSRILLIKKFFSFFRSQVNLLH